MNGLIGLGGVLVLLLGVGTVLGLLDRRRFSMRWLVVAAVLVAVNDALLTGFYGRLPDMIGGAWNWQGKLLALAATADDLVRAAAFAAGAEDAAHRGIDPDELRCRLRTLVRLGAATRRAQDAEANLTRLQQLQRKREGSQ